MHRTRTRIVVAASLAALAAATSTFAATSIARAQSDANGPPSVTVPVAPFRILDTRNGTGTAGSTVPVQAGQTIVIQVAGVGPIPDDATGVVLNITATEGTAPSFITAFPAGSTRPNASVLNVNPGQNLPNMITSTLGDHGQLALFNFTGSVHLVADVAGYLVPATLGSSGGATGPVGPPGPPGPAGAPGLSGYLRVSMNGSIPTLQFTSDLSVICPSGTQVIGGGVDAPDNVSVFASFPSSAQAWHVGVRKSSIGGVEYKAFAICAKVAA